MTEQDILAAIDGLTPELQRAYLDQVRDTVDSATLTEVERYIESGDEQGLQEYLSLGSMIFFLEALRSVFLKGGRAVKVRAPGYLLVPFDINAEGAQGVITEKNARIIKEIYQGHQEAIRIAMQAGLSEGRSRIDIAKDILGRVSKQTGNRTGGVIGMVGLDAQALVNARTQLESGDPAQMKQYLKRIDRDTIFDPVVKKAIAVSKPVSKVNIERILKHYAERKLKKRALFIGKTEAHEMYNAGIFQKYQQLKQGRRAPKSMIKRWRTQEDERVRETHEPLDGSRADLDEPFITIAGSMLMFPGDTSLGAPLFDRQNCRCTYSVQVIW